jgi:alpha/beta superfamily hydrolase
LIKAFFLKSIFFLTAIVLLSGCSLRDEEDSAVRLEGLWQGTLLYSGEETTFRIRFKRGPDGIEGNLSIPGEVLFYRDLTDLKHKGKRVRFTVGLVDCSAFFIGKLVISKTSANEISGRYRREKHRGTFRLFHIDEAPLAYREEDICFQNLNVMLSGTLTIPEGEGPFTAVVLVSTWGPQNRDAEINGFPIFREMADYLTRRGLAVLRYDERGIGRSSGSFDKSVFRDFTGDVRHAAVYLRGRPDISAVGFLGHGEGGMTAVKAAEQQKDTAFLILLSSPLKGFMSLSCPILAVWGGSDNLVPFSQNSAFLLRILEEYGHSDYTVKLFPQANHIYQPAVNDLPDGTASPGKRFVRDFPDFLFRWITVRFLSGRK